MSKDSPSGLTWWPSSQVTSLHVWSSWTLGHLIPVPGGSKRAFCRGGLCRPASKWCQDINHRFWGPWSNRDQNMALFVSEMGYGIIYVLIYGHSLMAPRTGKRWVGSNIIVWYLPLSEVQHPQKTSIIHTFVDMLFSKHGLFPWTSFPESEHLLLNLLLELG